MAPVFGQVSTPVGNSVRFGTGNAIDSSSPSAPNMNSSSSSTTQRSIFGSNGTNVYRTPSSSTSSSSTFSFGQGFGPTNSSHNTFSTAGDTSQNPFASSTNGTTTFPSFSTQGSIVGGSSTGVLGAQSPFSSASSPSSWTQRSPFGTSSIGLCGASPPFSSASSPSLTQGSLFNGNSTLAVGAPPSYFSSVQGSSFGGSSTSVYGALPCPFSSASSSRSLTQGSLFGGKSTCLFGARSPFSSSSSNFATAGSASSMFGTCNLGDTISTTLRGPFEGPPSTQWFGVESTRACGSTMMAGFTNNERSNQTARPFFGQTSNGLGTTRANIFSTSHNVGPIVWGQNKGSRIKSYEFTTIQDGKQSMKHMSISAMSTYASKSHEELRWEDYELKSQGQRNPINNKIQESNRQPMNVLSASTKPLFPVSLTSENINTTPKLNFPSPYPSPFPIFDTKKSMLSVSNSVLPQDPISPAAVVLQNPHLPTQSSRLALSFPAQSPSVGSGSVEGSQTNFTPFWKNGSMPLDFPQPQPNVPLQCSVTGKVIDSIIAVKDPFGSEPVTSQPSTGHFSCFTLVRHGISSMPVFNEPTIARPTRVSSLLKSRYHPVRSLAVNVRRYHPSTDVPKVPFFDLGEEIQYTSKPYSCVVPRENPRSVFAAASTEPMDSSIHKVSPMKHAATTVEHEDENVKEVQINSSPNCLKYTLIEENEAKEAYKLVIPKLQRPDYYTEPRIEKIASIESNNPGFCCHVKDFVVGRKGYGWVKFYGETDIRGLNLDSLIQFNDRELIVYDDNFVKPPVGQGLNKAAEVTLLNVKCKDKTGKQYISGKMVDKFVEKLKKVAEKQGAEFASYDAVEGVWKFIVQHF